jgi:hypothetical protein
VRLTDDLVALGLGKARDQWNPLDDQVHPADRRVDGAPDALDRAVVRLEPVAVDESERGQRPLMVGVVGREVAEDHEVAAVIGQRGERVIRTDQRGARCRRVGDRVLDRNGVDRLGVEDRVARGGGRQHDGR